MSAAKRGTSDVKRTSIWLSLNVSVLLGLITSAAVAQPSPTGWSGTLTIQERSDYEPPPVWTFPPAVSIDARRTTVWTFDGTAIQSSADSEGFPVHWLQNATWATSEAYVAVYPFRSCFLDIFNLDPGVLVDEWAGGGSGNRPPRDRLSNCRRRYGRLPLGRAWIVGLTS